MVAHDAADADAAWVRESLQSRGDVDAVAVDGAVGLLDDLAEIHSDAVAHATVVGDAGAALLHGRLDRNRRANRAGRGLENRQHRIPGHVDDPSVMLFAMAAEERAVRVELDDRRPLVRAHEARKADRVGRENCREPLLDPGVRQRGNGYTNRPGIATPPQPISDRPGRGIPCF